MKQLGYLQYFHKGVQYMLYVVAASFVGLGALKCLLNFIDAIVDSTIVSGANARTQFFVGILMILVSVLVLGFSIVVQAASIYVEQKLKEQAENI